MKKSAHIVSEPVTYRNRRGMRIVGFFDHPSSAYQNNPIVIISPSYGETKKTSLSLSYYLAYNGINVLRYDNSCHVGESEGEMVDFTLPGAVDDIVASIDFLQKKFKTGEVALLAMSLASRSAMRAAASDERISLLITLVGVVNLKYTLDRVYREDLVGNYIEGKRWGITDILGHDINFDNFLGAAVSSNMHDLAGTEADLIKIKIPISFFAAERDVWVNYKEVKKLMSVHANSQVVVVKAAMHELRENPRAAEQAFRQIAACCLSKLKGQIVPIEAINNPSNKAILRQNKLERTRLRTYKITKKSEQDFWEKYLTKYELLESVDDYKNYLKMVSKLLGKFKQDDVVLDAGCGNGFFGIWLLRDIMKAGNTHDERPPIYVGIDFAEQALNEAIYKHHEAREKATDSFLFNKNKTPVYYLYALMDLDDYCKNESSYNYSIKFSENCFDKICCSLLVSYVSRPVSLLKELFRVLKQGGSIIISSMKPYCDLSQIYRDFVDQIVTEDEVAAARGLLRAAGKIRRKEDEGYYKFYSKEELVGLINKSGFRNIQVFRSFGDQANVIKAEK